MPLVKPVPPLPTVSVPANVTTPVVAVLGVNPPSDVWNEATVPPVNANVPVVVGSVSVPVLTIVIAPVVAVNWSVV